MSIQELAVMYKFIGLRLHRAGYIMLSVDYRYVSGLVRESRDTPHLVAELRRNLNRGSEYLESEKRNATLHVMASTLERIVQA